MYACGLVKLEGRENSGTLIPQVHVWAMVDKGALLFQSGHLRPTNLNDYMQKVGKPNVESHVAKMCVEILI